jgi:hypothetical protein
LIVVKLARSTVTVSQESSEANSAVEHTRSRDISPIAKKTRAPSPDHEPSNDRDRSPHRRHPVGLTIQVDRVDEQDWGNGEIRSFSALRPADDRYRDVPTAGARGCRIAIGPDVGNGSISSGNGPRTVVPVFREGKGLVMGRLRGIVLVLVLATGAAGCVTIFCDECDDFPVPGGPGGYSMMPGTYTGGPVGGSADAGGAAPAAAGPAAGGAAPASTPAAAGTESAPSPPPAPAAGPTPAGRPTGPSGN